MSTARGDGCGGSGSSSNGRGSPVVLRFDARDQNLKRFRQLGIDQELILVLVLRLAFMRWLVSRFRIGLQRLR